MRGPIAPPQVPLAVTRAEFFDDLVRESAERLKRRWPQLAEVEFTVQEVPQDGEHSAHGTIPLGRLLGSGESGARRIVVYRRPVEIRAKSREERAALVHEIVVEQVADLLGLAPETVDPGYGQD